MTCKTNTKIPIVEPRKAATKNRPYVYFKGEWRNTTGTTCDKRNVDELERLRKPGHPTNRSCKNDTWHAQKEKILCKGKIEHRKSREPCTRGKNINAGNQNTTHQEEGGGNSVAAQAQQTTTGMDSRGVTRSGKRRNATANKNRGETKKEKTKKVSRNHDRSNMTLNKNNE